MSLSFVPTGLMKIGKHNFYQRFMPTAFWKAGLNHPFRLEAKPHLIP